MIHSEFGETFYANAQMLSLCTNGQFQRGMDVLVVFVFEKGGLSHPYFHHCIVMDEF